MAYCTENDLLSMIPVKELAELTAETGDTPDSLVVADAINRAEAEIDAYLGVRYTLPLSPVPDQVKGLSVDISLYHLYSRRSVAPPVRRQKYEAAVSFLKQVATGEALVEGGATSSRKPSGWRASLPAPPGSFPGTPRGTGREL
jgi:phage gp36-like protein